MIQRVYLEVSKELLESNIPVLACIRNNYGEYIIEGEIPGRFSVVSISFYTNEFEFAEGESHKVIGEMTKQDTAPFGHLFKISKS